MITIIILIAFGLIHIGSGVFSYIIYRNAMLKTFGMWTKSDRNWSAFFGFFGFLCLATTLRQCFILSILREKLEAIKHDDDIVTS